jgi:hypothetical protein
MTLKMKVKCKNCLPKEGIEVPQFTISDKSKILGIMVESPLHATMFIFNNFKLKQGDAKYIVTHLYTIYGKCNCCTYYSLDQECMNCPKCGALNFNWKIENGTKI